MKQRLKNKKKVVAIISILIGVITLLFYPFESDWSKQLDKDAVYLDVDSVYRTPAEKEKFFALEKQFLNHWLDTSNCFTKRFQRGKKPDLELRKVLDIYVDNIFHTSNYDTVIVLVSFHTAWINQKNGNEEDNLNYSQAMKATIDDTGKWSFNCDYGGYWLLHEKEDLQYSAKRYRRILISKGILNEYKEIDPKFFHRFFTEDISENVSNKKSWQEHLPESGPVK